MKKYGLICMLFILCMVWIGCSQAKPAPSEPSGAEPPPVTEPVVTDPMEPDEPLNGTEPEQGMGGTDWLMREAKYDFEFYGIPGRIADIVEEEAFNAWVEEAYSKSKENLEDYTILTFIDYFTISKDDLTKASQGWGEYDTFTDEEIEALYSKDPKQLADCFANPYAIRVGDEIYPAKWVVTHTVEEIAEAGITLEELTTKYARWEKCGTQVTDIPARVQAKLAEYKEYVENKQ